MKPDARTPPPEIRCRNLTVLGEERERETHSTSTSRAKFPGGTCLTWRLRRQLGPYCSTVFEYSLPSLESMQHYQPEALEIFKLPNTVPR